MRRRSARDGLRERRTLLRVLPRRNARPGCELTRAGRRLARHGHHLRLARSHEQREEAGSHERGTSRRSRTSRAASLAAAPALLPGGAPVKDRPGEGVVIDLVRAVAGGSGESALAASARGRLQPRAQDVRQLGEIVRPMRDLRPGRVTKLRKARPATSCSVRGARPSSRRGGCARSARRHRGVRASAGGEGAGERPLLCPEPAEHELEVGG